MKMKSAMVAVALLAASFANSAASAAPVDDVPTALGILYSKGNQYFTSFTSYANFYGALQQQAISNYTALVSYFNNGAPSVTSGFDTQGLWYANLTFSNNQVLSNGAVVNTTANTVTPVPGPEAGVGLGALAIGGVALFMQRRRKEEALGV